MNATYQPDIRSSSFKANPYPVFSRMRAEVPVLRVDLSWTRSAWLVTRYDDVIEVLKGQNFVKDKQNVGPSDSESDSDGNARSMWMPPIIGSLMKNMLDVDPPDHTRLRSLVQMAFTPRVVEELNGRIHTLTNELLDSRLSDGRMDIIRDFGLPLPSTIIAEMLGVPVSDRHRFHKWSNAMVTADPSLPDMIRAVPSVVAFVRYIRRLVRKRRSTPRDDLVSALVQAEDAGDYLDEDELVAMIFLLLVAGHETTVNLIGNSVLSLLRHPDQLALLCRSPEMMDTAVEELLRFDGPLRTATERYARVDVEMGGVRISEGDQVYAVLASANRDERFFNSPDELDLSRSPNQHLAFGRGIHYCLGAPLARLEGQIALRTLLERTKDLRLAVPESSLKWKKGLVLRGLESLPVTFRRASPGATPRSE